MSLNRLDMLWVGHANDRNAVPDLTKAAYVVKSVLTRNQLRDLLLLLRSNPQLDARKLTMLIMLNSDDYHKPDVLRRYGLAPIFPVPLAEEAAMACKDRIDFELQVLSLFSSS